MNATFNFQRFSKVLIKDASDYLPKFGWFLLIPILIPFLNWFFGIISGTENIMPTSRKIQLIILCIFSMTLLPSRLYGHCNDSKKGIGFAMMPASSFEKFLSMVLFSLIITPILFIIGSVALDTILVLVPNSSFQEFLWQGDVFLFDYIMTDIETLKNVFTFGNLILTALTFVTFFMIGNMLFKKHPTSKTYLLLMLIGVISIYLVFNNFFGHLETLQKEEDVKLYFEQIVRIGISLRYVVLAVILGATYLKIKKQTY